MSLGWHPEEQQQLMAGWKRMRLSGYWEGRSREPKYNQCNLMEVKGKLKLNIDGIVKCVTYGWAI